MSAPPRFADQVRGLFAYNRWANQRFLEAEEALSPADLNARLAGSFGTLRNTLVHVLSAEWVWLRRWKGESPTSMLDPVDFPDVASIRWRWKEIELECAPLLAALRSESLGDELHYESTGGEQFEQPLHEILLHVINHSTYHRGQMTTMLRQLGRTPPSTDLILYYRRMRAGGA